jgi:hypothetical protein
MTTKAAARILTSLVLVVLAAVTDPPRAGADSLSAKCAHLAINWKGMNLPPGVVDQSTDIEHGAIVTSAGLQVGYLFQTVRDGTFYFVQFDDSTPQTLVLSALTTITGEKKGVVTSGSLFEVNAPLQLTAQTAITINPCF